MEQASLKRLDVTDMTGDDSMGTPGCQLPKSNFCSGREIAFSWSGLNKEKEKLLAKRKVSNEKGISSENGTQCKKSNDSAAVADDKVEMMSLKCIREFCDENITSKKIFEEMDDGLSTLSNDKAKESLTIMSEKSPPDGGWGWMCMLGMLYCFLCGYGTHSTFGIIYIDLIEHFKSSREETAWIGSLNSGFSFLAGPLASALISRFGIQKTTAVGSLLAFSGCFISWFATGIPYLYVSYGVVMGLGVGVFLVPSIMICPQYFKKRLGLANAIGSSGTGIGVLTLPYLYTYLLEEYGWRGTLLILSGVVLNTFVCAVIFISPPHVRSQEKNSTSKTKSSLSCTNLRYMCSPYIILHIAGTSLVFLGYYTPFAHLPDMAVQRDIDKDQTAILMSIMGVSSIVGRIFFGWLSDFRCVNVVLLQVLSLLVCGVVTAVCPHLTEFYALAVYSVLFGAFSGVFVSLIPVVIVYLVGVDRTTDVIGIVLFLAGIMNTVASPAAGWLFDTTQTYNVSFYFASCPFILGGVMGLAVMVLHKRPNAQIKEVEIQTIPQSNIYTQEPKNTKESIYM